MRIIALSGTGGSGKTTFARFCGEYANVVNFSSVDYVKAAAAILGWEWGSKTDRDRAALSELTQLADNYFDHRKKYIHHVLSALVDQEYAPDIVFVDIREPQMIQWLVDTYDAHSLVIIRDDIPPITTNPSDANVLEQMYTFTIYNKGDLDELKQQAKWFIKNLTMPADDILF